MKNIPNMFKIQENVCMKYKFRGVSEKLKKIIEFNITSNKLNLIFKQKLTFCYKKI